MDGQRLKVGVLSNYNVYIVVLRIANDHIAISDPVLRSTSLRQVLDPPLANDMSVWELLLALLLYAAQPTRLETRGSIWSGLWVKDVEDVLRPGKRTGGKRPLSSPTKNRARQSDEPHGKGDIGDGGPVSGDSDSDMARGTFRRPEDLDYARAGGVRHVSDSSDTSSISNSMSEPSLATPRDRDKKSRFPIDIKTGVGDESPFKKSPLNLDATWSTFSPSLSPHLHAKTKIPSTLSPSMTSYHHPTPTLCFDLDSPHVPEQELLRLAEQKFRLVVPPRRAPLGDVRLSVNHIISYGQYFTTFAASSDTPIVHSSLVFKLARLTTPSHHHESRLPSGREVRRTLDNEVQILTGPLNDLQGSVVPTFHGLWRADEWAIILLERVDSPSISHSDMGLPTDGSADDGVRQAYTALHSRGVVHGDVEPRHLFFMVPRQREQCGRVDRVRIIDFDRAQAFKVRGSGWDAAVARENREVERLLSLCRGGRAVYGNITTPDRRVHLESIQETERFL